MIRNRARVWTAWGTGAAALMAMLLFSRGLSAEKPDLVIRGKHRDVKVIGGMAFVYLGGGEFSMGSHENTGYENERPRHAVFLDPFLMGKFEVTQGQYRALMGKNPSFFTGDTRPVERVSWDDAVEFAERFGKKYGVPARLPFEAEWEYACRAGTATLYPWGEWMNGAYCWYNANSNDETQPVGRRAPNAWGLHDMLGNVYEWCIDYYSGRYYSESQRRNPGGPPEGVSRVARGGAWHIDEFNVRPAFRLPFRPGTRDFYNGFRLVIPASLQER